MRRALFVSYWVPPRTDIGTVRSSHLLKHLRRFGWEVTVVTARLGAANDGPRLAEYVETRYFNVRRFAKRIIDGRALQVPAKAPTAYAAANGTIRGRMRRMLLGAFDIFTYRDEHVAWLPFASQTLKKLAARGGWDAVLSTAPPMTASVAAAIGRGGVPWAADLRDLWAEDDSSERSKLQALLDDKFERAVLSGASALIASSQLSAARFHRRYPDKPCYGIFTGFEPEEWQSIPFASERECTLLYAGTLYKGKRDPAILFSAVRAILDDGLAEPAELRLDFYTAADPWLVELVGRFHLGDVVSIRGFQSRDEVLAAERRADRLVLLSWDGPTAEGVVPGKLFEYFGARRPILAFGGPSVSEVQLLLSKTGAGISCATFADAKREVLNALYEHRRGRHRIIGAQAVSSFTGENCARQFAAVLGRIAQ